MQFHTNPVACNDSAAVAYTVPAGWSAFLSSAQATNNHSQTQNVTLSYTPSGGAKKALATNVPVITGAAGSLLVSGVKQLLAVGDTVTLERGASSGKPYMAKSIVAIPNATFSGAVALAYGGTRLVALGPTAATMFSMATSDDSGVTWTVRGSSFGASGVLLGGLYSASGARYVFWGNSASSQPGLYHTYDGTALYRSYVNNTSGVCHNGSSFVITSQGSSPAHLTTNGQDFSFGPALSHGAPASKGKTIAYGNSLYVSTSTGTTNTVSYSTDGLNWTLNSTPTSAAAGLSMSFANGIFFRGEASGTELQISTDAVSWTNKTVPSGAVSAVAWGNSVYVASNGATSPWYSADTTTWNTATTTGVNSNDVVYASSKFVSVGAAGVIFTSTDGNNWTSRTSNTSNALNSVVWNGTNLFVAVGAAGTIVTSPDGSTAWTVRTSNTTAAITQVDYNGTMYLALAGSSHLTSTDGITWVAYGSTNNVAIATGTVTGVAADGSGNFIFAFNAATFFKSTSYGKYTSVTPSPACNTGLCAYGGGRWVLGSNAAGTCVTSSDLTTWSTPSFPITGGINGLTYGGGNFYAIGTSSSIIYKTANPVTGWTNTGVSGPSGSLMAYANGYAFTYGGGASTGDNFSSDGFVANNSLVLLTSFTPTLAPVYISGTSMLWATAGNLHTVDFPTGSNSYLFSGALSITEFK